MANAQYSQLIVWILVCTYTVSTIVLYFWHHKYADEVKSQNKYITQDTMLHGRLSLIGIILCGAGMSIFRIFRGYRTRVIKYVHLAVQTLAVIFLICGFMFASNYSEEQKGLHYPFTLPPGRFYFTSHVPSEVHIIAGYMMFVAIILQYIFGLLAFTYVFAQPSTRLFLAPFHEVFGIWILISLVVTYLSGVYFWYDVEFGFFKLEKTHVLDVMSLITAPVYLSFLIILIIVITPYFEWELVGPL